MRRGFFAIEPPPEVDAVLQTTLVHEPISAEQFAAVAAWAYQAMPDYKRQQMYFELVAACWRSAR